MKRSIFLKIFGGYLVISIVLAFLIIVFSFSTIKNFHLNSLAKHLQHLGEALEFQVVPMLNARTYQELDAFLKDFGKRIETRITLIDREGVVLADSDENPKNMENHGFRSEIMTAYAGGIGRSLRYSRTVKQEMLYIAIPIKKDEAVTHVLRTSLYVRGINDLLSSLRRNIWLFGVVIIAISMIGAFFFSLSLSRPLTELNSASRRIAAGEFNTKVFLKKRDEFRILADSFNFMTDHIKNLFDELNRKKEQLDSILRSIQEGLLVLDKDGRIFLTNDSFKKIAHTETIEGKLYWEILREPALEKLFQRVRAEKMNLADEIELSGKIFLVSAAFLPYEGAVVATFHDITEIRNVERIKKDFIVNVSHELRTPLTAIKGFVETLEEEMGKNQKSYLDIIKRNTDRLISIVSDLLIQAELEEKYIKLEVEEVDLKTMITHIHKIFEPKLEEKGLTFSLHVEEGFPSTIKGDSFKLEQLFINIFDNAVKFTQKGKIAVNFRQKNKDVYIVVEDTGIGIPQKDLSRVFERFYMVDKSRSRQMGGSGLGLSIAKHIVGLHGGQVSIESILGKGTKVIVKLPA